MTTLTKELYERFCEILEAELVPAMGCTEPIAIALAAARAKDILGSFPESVKISVSGNIIKNAKSVVVPHTGSMRGIESAAIAGLVGGNAEDSLEVLKSVTDEHIRRMAEVKELLPIEVAISDSPLAFDIEVTLRNKEDSAYVRIADRHTNIITERRNNELLLDKKPDSKSSATDRYEELTVEGIVAFVDMLNVDDVRPVLDRQIKFNTAIAEEGLSGNYGANIGKTYLSAYTPDISIKAKAYAAAGSDARMNGCELPVIINSGSGNQGMTASLPVIVYWQEMKLGEDMLYRALALSNLLTIHIKRGIGTLSAYCGAVAAGAAAGAGIAYLHGGGFREVAHTLVNALAIDSGLICDGAKASCAAKIATAVENGILGFNLFKMGNQFVGGDGIVTKGVENTIRNVCRLAKNGMTETDKEILNIMMQLPCDN